MPISPAAIGIIFNEDQSSVLLIQRRDTPVWVLPGGGIEKDETAEEAVIREVYEETGLYISIQRKCAEYTPINRLATFTTVFICQIERGSLSQSNETSDIAFYPLNRLPALFFPIHNDWLQDALTHSSLIRKPLNNITYWNAFKYICKHPLHMIRYMITRRKNGSN